MTEQRFRTLVTLAAAVGAMLFAPAGATEVRETPQRHQTILRLLKKRDVSLYAKHKGYTVCVKYPQYSGADSSNIRKLNRAIKLLVDQNIPTTPGEGGRVYEYSCKFEQTLLTPKLLGLLFEFYDWEDGAHGATKYVSMHYELGAQFHRLTDRELFNQHRIKPLSQLYSKKFSDLFRAPVTVNLRSQNATVLSLTTEGVKCIIPEGTISAYADGSPSQSIRYEALTKFLSPKLKSLIRKRSYSSMSI